MEAKFTFTPDLTEEEYMTVSEKNRKDSIRIMRLTVTGIFVFWILTILFLYLVTGEISIFSIIVTFAFPVFLLIRWKKAIRKVFNSTALANEATSEYRFYDDYFTVVSKYETITVPYTKLIKINFMLQFIYLYLNSHSIFIIHNENPDFIDFISEIKANYNL